MTLRACGQEFVDSTRPILETGDLELLFHHLQQNWPPARLREMLSCGHPDAVKVALFCLSLVGKMGDAPAVAELLEHEDSYVGKLAEHAMWSIWFQDSDEAANLVLRRAVEMMGEDRLDDALDELTELLAGHPAFAEAYDQRAIVHFLKGSYEAAREDWKEALRLNPLHFAAIGNLGHCLAVEGRWEEALAQYRQALRMHPRAEGLQMAIRELLGCLAGTTGDGHEDRGGRLPEKVADEPPRPAKADAPGQAGRRANTHPNYRPHRSS